jgi:hypothetical protein
LSLLDYFYNLVSVAWWGVEDSRRLLGEKAKEPPPGVRFKSFLEARRWYVESRDSPWAAR